MVFSSSEMIALRERSRKIANELVAEGETKGMTTLTAIAAYVIADFAKGDIARAEYLTTTHAYMIQKCPHYPKKPDNAANE